MGVRVPADKRFHRSHIKPSRRRTIWQQGCRLGRTVVILALVGYALHRATDLVLNASMLAIDKIEVGGAFAVLRGGIQCLGEPFARPEHSDNRPQHLAQSLDSVTMGKRRGVSSADAVDDPDCCV